MNSAPVELHGADTTVDQWRDREWLITNGLGGYASGTVLGDVTRRYHGLFVPNLAQPKGRHLMVSRLVEEVSSDGRTLRLGDQHAHGESHLSDSLHCLQSFRVEGNVAIWLHEWQGARWEKSILMPHSQNTVCVRYRILAGKLSIKLRPYLPFRRHDAELRKSGSDELSVLLHKDRCEVALRGSPLQLRFATQLSPTQFVADWHETGYQLLREQRRGNECEESLLSPGYFQSELSAGSTIALIASTHSWERVDINVEASFVAESRRTAMLVKDVDPQDDFLRRLTVAADQFLVLPASRIEDVTIAAAEGHELRTVIAGYHWFGDWGRDTMISLEGLMLCTKRFREARATLQTFAGYVSDGLIPNLFPEGEREGLYHTVDATLWYFHAVHRYMRATLDASLLDELLPVLRSIVDHYVRGTRFGIKMDPNDGLITASAAGYQLTWMDAKVDNWVVTPRRGKPVEIQALWYNALSLMANWVSSDERAQYERLAAQVNTSFNRRYWNDARNCLFDVLDGPDGADAAVRPNQMFAISLDYPVLAAARWNGVIDCIEQNLLTPLGLRTLSRDHPDYKSSYNGDLRARDAAYHQGTVWPWLIGHFIDAKLKVTQDKASVRKLLRAFPAHLAEAGIGTISEIFDGDPPHAPHGCIAQAWSVAEVLRAWSNTSAMSSRLR
jgi:predicted glycogen debranching enzyme